LEVSAIGLGTWSYGGANWGKVDLRECALALNTALDNGVNCIDTAPSYGEGGSEKFLAKHLKARRSDVILSSKCGIKMDEHYSHALSPAFYSTKNTDPECRQLVQWLMPFLIKAKDDWKVLCGESYLSFEFLAGRPYYLQ